MNEQSLDKKKKTVTKKRAVITMIVGLIIGLALITAGIIRTNAIERNAAADKPVLAAELAALADQEFDLEKQQRDSFLENGFSDEYYEIARQLEQIGEEIRDVKSQLRNTENLTFEKSKSIPFFVFGGFIIFLTILGSLSAFAAAKVRSAMPDPLETMKQARADAPKVARTCPKCGATTLPDANGRCEYCGGAVLK